MIKNFMESSEKNVLNKDFEKKILQRNIILPGFKEIYSKKNDSYSKNHYFNDVVNPWNKKKLRNKNYYQKSKELEIFNQIKTKIKFDSYPQLLRDGKFYTISKRIFTMYHDKFYNKLYEIKLKKDFKIISTILLDNNDLIFAGKYQIKIYRLKNGKYFLFQKIDENQRGYEPQNVLGGCLIRPLFYAVEFIKEISGNRFICVSNYGFKLYSLNEKNKKYSIVSYEIHNKGLKTIHEINENNFLFCSENYRVIQFSCESLNEICIEKICLKEITNKEKEYKLKILEKKDYNNKIDKKEVKNLFKLKFKSVSQKIFEYDDYEKHNFNYVILKNKYLIVGFDNNIFIFDIFSGNILKKYEILIKDYSFKFHSFKLDIKKWNNKNDNKFLICLNIDESKKKIKNCYGFYYYTDNLSYYCIVLSELTDNVLLKVIDQSYFTNINNIKNLSEKENKFYEYDNNYCISIF